MVDEEYGPANSQVAVVGDDCDLDDSFDVTIAEKHFEKRQILWGENERKLKQIVSSKSLVQWRNVSLGIREAESLRV